jgi:hypothetical protein
MPFWETDPVSFKFPQLSEFTDSELARHGMTRHQARLLDTMFSNANAMAVKFIADVLLELVDLVKPQMTPVSLAQVEETTDKIRAWMEKFNEINRGPGI